MDSFDDPDDSLLLVSPAVNRGRARDDRQHVTAAVGTDISQPYHSTRSSTAADGSLDDEDSFMLAQTPAKSKFNYASAMEELECLAPTPATAKATAKKERMPGALYATEEVEGGNGSPLVEYAHTKQHAASLGSGRRVLFSLPSSSLPTTERGAAAETKYPPGDDESSSSASLQTPEQFSPINPPDDTASDEAINAPNNHCVDDASSVFRHPCIRKSISDENSSLELKLGHPVNESYDSTEASIANNGLFGGKRMIKDTDLSMEVEKASADIENGELLVGAVSGEFFTRLDHHVGSNGEDQTDGFSEGDADVNVGIDLAINQGKVIHRRPKFCPLINEDKIVPWDSMCSDDSEETNEAHNQPSGYVEKMRNSIDSYFSIQLGTLPEGDDGGNNDVLESFDKSERRAESPPLCNSQKGDISSESQGTSYSDESDDNLNERGTINISAMGDDASQIDVDDTLEYAGYVHSSHHQRYDDVLGGANNAPNDEEGGRTSIESCNQFQDCLVHDETIVENKPEAEYVGESSFLSNTGQLESDNCNDSESIADSSYSSKSNRSQAPADINDQLIDASFGRKQSSSAPEDTVSSTKPTSEYEQIFKTASSSANNDVRDVAKVFCGFHKGSTVGIDHDFAAEHANIYMDASNDDESQLPVIQEAKSSLSHPNDDVPQETESSLEQRTDHELLASSPNLEKSGNINFDQSYITNQMLTRSTLLKVPELCALPDDCLSPISKSSSPHNSCEFPSGAERPNDDMLGCTNDWTQHEFRVNHHPKILDKSLTSDDYLWKKYQRDESSEQALDNNHGTLKEMRSILADKVGSESPELDASAEGSDEAHTRANTKASIFQVLSHQPVKERYVDLHEDSIQGRAPEETTGVDQPDHYDYKSAETEELDQPIATAIQKLRGSAYGIEGKQQPSPEIVSQSKIKSLDELPSYQQRLNFTSNAFMERLRGAAEYRKREVTRGRYSMERKEQILYEEKKVRVETSMPAVDEEMVKKLPRKSAAPRKSKLEGEDPYIPFKARPLPASTTERVNSRTGTQSLRYSSASLGAKRKTSNAFRPHPSQNESNVKISALNVKPPKRLLSGEDASIAREMNHRKRLQEEEERIKRESTFIARPLPVTTLTRSQLPLAGENLLSSQSVQGGKENEAFIPGSSIRAEKRKSYNVEKAIREQQRREADIERRQQLIEQTKNEINDLTRSIR